MTVHISSVVFRLSHLAVQDGYQSLGGTYCLHSRGAMSQKALSSQEVKSNTHFLFFELVICCNCMRPRL